MKSGILSARKKGSSVGEALNPCNGYREKLLRKGVTPKDHMKANKQFIKHIQNAQKAVQEKPQETKPKLPSNQTNYVKQNIKSAKILKPKDTTTPPDKDFREDYQTYGQVPKYISSIKQELQTKKQEELYELSKKHWPKGTRLLSEQERTAHLDALVKARDEAWNALAKLPFTSDTFAVKQKRSLLESRLKNLETGISRFSLDKVYVEV